MYSKFWPRGGLPGILHHYTESLVAFEFTSGAARKPHSLVFIGGLGDGLGTTPYVADLVHSLQSTEWSVFQLNITSSYQSWGLGHLDRDTNEIAQCLRYVKDYKTAKYGSGKVVLMGHSTGSQHVLHYLYRSNPHTSKSAFDSDLEHVTRLPLDGAIMQAPVSDREAVQLVMKQGWMGKSPSETEAIYEKLKALAQEAVSSHDQSYDTLLPLSLTTQFCYPANTPISARRFLSLVSPETPHSPSEDDLFSSDLSDEQFKQTFGAIQKQGLLKSKLMVLISGADQAVPEWVDKEKMLSRFKNATTHDGEYENWNQEFSAIIPGASHALSNDDQGPARKFLAEKVSGYLQALPKA